MECYGSFSSQRFLSISILLGLFFFPTLLPLYAKEKIKVPTQLLTETKQAQVSETLHNKARTANYIKTEQQLAAELVVLKQQVSELEKYTQSLEETFKANEQSLVKKEQELLLATGSLDEIFDVVRQAAKELKIAQSKWVISPVEKPHNDIINDIISARTLPSREQLYGLWYAFAHYIKASSELTPLKLPIVQPDGNVFSQPVVRLGAMGLGSNYGYLAWDPIRQLATPYTHQPNFPLTLESRQYQEPFLMLDLDATHGDLLTQQANVPTLYERINRGGIIGQIILSLLAIGILMGVVQGGILFVTKIKIKQQLKQLDTPQMNNPLGRIMNVYQEDKTHNIEVLEWRLLEGVMEEQQYLERGLSLIKLFAVLAPMLGLLGTVIGMINTFQAITQFGNTEPQVMAGGISMALITTVLGLIAAMPLLIIHNRLNSQVESIRNIIEKQGVGMVAERAEKNMVTSKAL